MEEIDSDIAQYSPEYVEKLQAENAQLRELLKEATTGLCPIDEYGHTLVEQILTALKQARGMEG